MTRTRLPDRRRVTGWLVGAATAAALPGWRTARAAVEGDEPALPAGARDGAEWLTLAGKQPLIKRSYRPPNLETPRRWFGSVLTPNDAFFVRYHHAGIPEVALADWRLALSGPSLAKPLSFTLDELRRRFEPVELTALCLCSGNRRGLFEPHVMGIQWGRGAMGNARWRGVRLADLLAAAGLQPGALEVVFDGSDSALLGGPDFRKSLPVWKATDPNVIVAYEMNGVPLPHWNGFPARLVVPGWTATYWIKHLATIEVIDRPFDGFWMKTGYRIPRAKFPVVERFVTQETETTTPITEIAINTLVTAPLRGARLALGRSTVVEGMAWDAGHGLDRVEVSVDGGASWRSARLGDDPGRFSLRPWRFEFMPTAAGPLVLLARATNRLGMTQSAAPIANPSGYHHNVVEPIEVLVA
jgi:DMSO/TMAO reductase YedYZ molybdopterin-dependent catalytic subunit